MEQSSTRSEAPGRRILSKADWLQRDLSKASSLTSEQTGLTSESSNVIASKCDSSDVKNKHTKLSVMSSSSSTNQTNADGSISTSSTEHKNTSGKPIDEHFRTNKKASKRAVAKITQQSLSLVNTVDNSAMQTNIKMDNFKFSLKGNVPEHSVDTIASPPKELTSSNDHFVLSDFTQNTCQSSLRDKHLSKISGKNLFRETPPRFKRGNGNAQPLAGHLHKHQKNNVVFHQQHSNKSSKTHAGDSTRNLVSHKSMGRTSNSHDYSQTAMHRENDSFLVHSPRTCLSSKLSNIKLTSNERHSPKELHDYIEAKSCNSSCGSFDSNYGIRLNATADSSTESNHKLSSHTRHSPSSTHSSVDSEDSYGRHCEQWFRNSAESSVVDSNYGLRLYVTTDSSTESNDKLSSPTTYSPRSTYSVDSENSYSQHYGSEQWFRNSGESRVDLTSNYRRSPIASDNVQWPTAYSPSYLYFPKGSGKSAESKQGHSSIHKTLEDIISDSGCSLKTLNFPLDQSAQSHEGRGQSATALDDAISQPECLLNSPIGSGRRAQSHIDYSIKPSGICDKAQLRKMKGELERHVYSDGKQIKLRLRNCDVSNPETSPKDLEGNIFSSTNQPQKTEDSKFIKYEILSTTDISHAQNSNVACNRHHLKAVGQKVTSEGNAHSQHASGQPNVLHIITENARALNVPQINPNEQHVPQPWPNEQHVPQRWTNEQQGPQPWPNKSHVPQLRPYSPHVPPPLPYTPHVPPPLLYTPNVPPPRPYGHYVILAQPYALHVSPSWPYTPHVSPSRPNAPHVSPSRPYAPHVSPSRPNAPHVSPSRPYAPHVSPSRPYAPHVSPSRPYNPHVTPPRSYNPHVPPPYPYNPHVPPPYPYNPHVPPPRLYVSHVPQICVNESPVSQPTLDEPSVPQPNLDDPSVSQPSQDDLPVSQPCL